MTDNANQDIPGGDSSDSAGGDGKTGVEEKVSRATYLKTLDEAKTFKKQVKELSERLSVFENEKKTAEENQKLAQNQHLDVIAQLKKDLETANAKNSTYESQFVDFRKSSAVQSALVQKDIKVDPKYHHLIDFDSIEVDAQGQIDASSVHKVIDEFQKEHPVLIQSRKSPPPGGKTGGSGGSLTTEEWAKLPLKEQRERFKDIRQ